MRAFLFPGQGSQKVGMGKDLVEKHHLASEIYKAADEILGFSISELCFNGNEEDLTKTQNAQPAILIYSYIVSELLLSQKVEPQFIAGHSLGEFSAILCAGMLPFEEMVRIVRKRGELMSASDPDGQGGMAAVLGLDDETVRAVCLEVSKTKYIEPVNYNTPGQVVISGYKEAIDLAEEKLKEKGAKRVLKLTVSGAFHSRLMEGASEEFGDFLSSFKFKKPKYTIISNVTARPYDETQVVDLLVKQMKSPVLWVDSVEYLKNNGVNEAIEVGFGNVISGMVKKIAPDIAMKLYSEY